MTFTRPALLLAAALCLGGAPAWAQEAPPAPAEAATGEAITIPFAPPIGTPLAYRLRFERKRASGDSVFEVDQRLTFAKMEGGYALTLEQMAIYAQGQRLDLSDRRVLDAVPLALRIFLLPVVVELDATGEMVRMRDWPAMKAALQGMPEAAAALSGEPVNEAALAAVRSVLDPILNGSAEDAPALMIRGWPAALGYGGGEFVAGELLEGDTEVVSPLAPTPIPAVSQGSVTRTPQGQIMLVQTTLFDPEVMRTLTLALIERVRTQAGRTGGAKPDEELLSLNITDEVAITFDPVTGLPITARTTRLTNVATSSETQVAGEVTTITRIDP
jgi:hypothetical protein